MSRFLRRARSARLIACAGAGFFTAIALGGCGQKPVDDTVIVRPDAPPTYALAAAKFNSRVELLSRVFVSAGVVRIRFVDDKGVEHNEQVEGTLQLVRPDRLALNIRKVGQTLFWLGCDGTRYWWFDVTGETRYGVFGRHDRFRPALAGKLGLSIQPLDLVRLLAVTPLPVQAGTLGGTSWSRDGRRLGINTPLEKGGVLRVWVDPETYDTLGVELFDAQERLVTRATHAEPRDVTLWERSEKPRWASSIIIEHLSSGSRLNLTLTDATDGHRRISDKAFDFDALSGFLRPDKTIDLDTLPDDAFDRSNKRDSAGGDPARGQ